MCGPLSPTLTSLRAQYSISRSMRAMQCRTVASSRSRPQTPVWMRRIPRAKTMSTLATTWRSGFRTQVQAWPQTSRLKHSIRSLRQSQPERGRALGYRWSMASPSKAVVIFVSIARSGTERPSNFTCPAPCRTRWFWKSQQETRHEGRGRRSSWWKTMRQYA